MWKKKDLRQVQNRPSEQNRLILLLFFLTFALNLIIYLITFEINRGLRFFILAESHYKGLYLNSVTALTQYMDTQSEGDFEEFHQNLNRMFSYKEAFEEAISPDRNIEKVEGMLGIKHKVR